MLANGSGECCGANLMVCGCEGLELGTGPGCRNA